MYASARRQVPLSYVECEMSYIRLAKLQTKALPYKKKWELEVSKRELGGYFCIILLAG